MADTPALLKRRHGRDFCGAAATATAAVVRVTFL